jgi:uncharacterized protein YyaL (SSP411 family)
MTQPLNRLADSSSPYLRQHADNPVDWWPWGADAFAEARRRDVPVFLSIGYATCHWCHVMATDSFTDPATAAQINAGYVPVKVDREQLPGVDAVYLQATQALTGQGGWPMTVVTDADGRPFFAGTFFRRDQLRQLLTALTRVWTTDRAQVEGIAGKLTAALSAAAEEDRGTASWAAQDATTALPARIVDAGAGVVEGAPTFPPSAALLGLVRAGETGRARETLHAMLRGGLYDQLAGGFHRYCVDADWHVPHFEKTLYDNALLLRAMAACLADRPADLLVRRAAEKTVDFLTGELETADGLFASGLDADTDGVEGLTYTWTPPQVRGAMEAWRTRMPEELRREPAEAESDARYAMAAFGVTDDGDIDGRSVLTYPRDIGYGSGERGEDLAANEALPWEARGIIDDWKTGGDGGAAENLRMHRVRKALLAARRERPRPAVDDKTVTAWNAMAAVALTEAAGPLTGSSDTAGPAVTARLWDHAVLTDDDGTVLDVVRCTGEPASPGTLEDCAWLLLALVRAWECGRDEGAALAGQVSELIRYIQLVFSRTGDGHRGTWYDGADSVAGTGVRPREPYDGATPAAVGVLAEALSYAGALAGTAQDADLRTLGGRWSAEARRILDAHTTVIERHLPAAGGWLCALTAHLAGPVTATVRGASDVQISGLRADLGTSALIVRTEDGAELVGETPGDTAGAVVQICRAGVCEVAQPLPGAREHR